MDNLSRQNSHAGIVWGGGPVKGNKLGAIGLFSQSVKKGLMENGISWSKISRLCSKLAQIEAGFKLHPVKASRNQNLLFLGL